MSCRCPGEGAQFLMLLMRSKCRRVGFALIRALASADAVNLIWDQFPLIHSQTKVCRNEAENIILMLVVTMVSGSGEPAAVELVFTG